MIVLMIIGVIASIAYPNYSENVRVGRRTDAKNTLLAAQLAQERWRAQNPAYANNLAAINVPAVSPGGFYNINLAASDAVSFTITATPIAGTSQANDANCPLFTITQNGYPVAQRNCWEAR
jgi:type IV pilus assembly protein PilE